MKEYFVKTKNGKISVQACILKGKKALLFLHGIGGSVNSWGLIKPLLSKLNYSYIYLDLRGHGKSYRPIHWKEYRFENHVEDIDSVLKRFNINKVILIGHCLGAMIATTFTSLYPEKVEKIILINPGLNNRSIFFNKFTNQILLIFYNFFKQINIFYPKKLERADYSKYKGDYDISPKRLFADYSHTGLVSIFAQALAFFDWDAKKTYLSICSPTLIVRGKNDILFSEEVSKSVQRFIKNSKLIHANTNHVSVINKPETIAKHIMNFLN